MTLPFNRQDLNGLGINAAQPEGKKMDEALTKALNAVSGTKTIAIGTLSVNVDVDRALHGQPVFATLNGKDSDGTADATATTLLTAGWSASVLGRFTIRLNANATAIVRVSYRVEGKSVG